MTPEELDFYRNLDARLWGQESIKVAILRHIDALERTVAMLAETHQSTLAQQEGNPVTRESWDDYFLRIAEVVASRSTCPRQHVGCVIVGGRRILSTGYNGSVPGEEHCDDAGCEMEHGHCVRTIHAELNAILHAAGTGVTIGGATAYITHEPCPRCRKHLIAAGIARIVSAPKP